MTALACCYPSLTNNVSIPEAQQHIESPSCLYQVGVMECVQLRIGSVLFSLHRTHWSRENYCSKIRQNNNSVTVSFCFIFFIMKTW